MKVKDCGTLKRSKRWSRWIERQRKLGHYTQKEWALKLGVSPSYVSRFEKNSWVPSYATVVKIAARLHLDMWDVLREAEYVQ
jgi:transcriptional regulator with XRE-family HTH domain